jgi:hypothetical protein
LFIIAGTPKKVGFDGEYLTLIRNYFEAARAMSPTTVGNGTVP